MNLATSVVKPHILLTDHSAHLNPRLICTNQMILYQESLQVLSPRNDFTFN